MKKIHALTAIILVLTLSLAVYAQISNSNIPPENCETWVKDGDAKLLTRNITETETIVEKSRINWGRPLVIRKNGLSGECLRVEQEYRVTKEKTTQGEDQKYSQQKFKCAEDVSITKNVDTDYGDPVPYGPYIKKWSEMITEKRPCRAPCCEREIIVIQGGSGGSTTDGTPILNSQGKTAHILSQGFITSNNLNREGNLSDNGQKRSYVKPNEAIAFNNDVVYQVPYIQLLRDILQLPQKTYFYDKTKVSLKYFKIDLERYANINPGNLAYKGLLTIAEEVTPEELSAYTESSVSAGVYKRTQPFEHTFTEEGCYLIISLLDATEAFLDEEGSTFTEFSNVFEAAEESMEFIRLNNDDPIKSNPVHRLAGVHYVNVVNTLPIDDDQLQFDFLPTNWSDSDHDGLADKWETFFLGDLSYNDPAISLNYKAKLSPKFLFSLKPSVLGFY